MPEIRFWYRYPVHPVDDTDILSDSAAEGEPSRWQKRTKEERTNAKADKKAERSLQIRTVYDRLKGAGQGDVSLDDVAETVGVSTLTIRRALNNGDVKGLGILKGNITEVKS